MDYYQQRILAGEAILFIGSGASYNCTDTSGKRIGFSGNELKNNISDKFLGGLGDKEDLEFASTMAIRRSGRLEFDLFIKNLVDNFEPTTEHKLLPKYRWKAIFTTNYDEAIEKSYYEERKEAKQKLERVLSDSDPLGQIMSDSNKLPLIKLHGCVSRINDTQLPLIISVDDYRNHLNNRSGLFQTLKEFLTNNIVIFYGYSLSDRNIIGLISDIDREGRKRPRHIWIDPYMDDLKMEYWQSMNLDCKKSSLLDFLEEIPVESKPFSQVLSLQKNSSKISKLISSQQVPSQLLEDYINKQLIYTNLDNKLQIDIDNYNKKLFYLGNAEGFGWTGSKLDFRRTIQTGITDTIFLEAGLSESKFNFYLISGYAGSGKTVLLKRLAWDGSNEFDKPCFYLEEGSLLNVTLIIELIELIEEPLYLFIDDILEFQKDIIDVKNYCEKAGKVIHIIGVSRSNEWNNSNNKLDFLDPKIFNLLDLDNSEIHSLLLKLKENDAEGDLKNLSDKERFDFIKNISNKQLIVTLLEATFQGKEFAEIVKDEYEKIYSRSAKELYLNICTLHQYGIRPRAGMISRLSGISFNDFKDEFLLPLELLVLSKFSYKDGDNVYSTRHSSIAESVYSQAFDSPTEKAQNLIKIIKYLNISYQTDKEAVELLLRGKLLAENFVNKDLVQQIYNIAHEIGLNESFLLHQQAIYESTNENGDLKFALDLLKRINQEDKSYDIRIVHHTMANIYRKMALFESHDKRKQEYWTLAKGLIQRIPKMKNNPLNFQLKGTILLDEIKYLPSDNPDLIKLIEEFESNLNIAFRNFPDDQSLIALEYDYSNFIENDPNAINKLEQVLRKNTNNIFLLQRFAKYHIKEKNYGTARIFLEKYLHNNINDKDINFLMAQTYIDENERDVKNIIRYLRKSYSPNDKYYLRKFEHARIEFSYGNEQKGNELFKELESYNISSTIKNTLRGSVTKEDGTEKLFLGNIVTINNDFGFVKCVEYSENIYFHRSCLVEQTQWEKLSRNNDVIFTITFTFKGVRVKTLSLQ